jgi:hypothetical protein
LTRPILVGNLHDQLSEFYWDILKNGVVVARLSSTEWELYRNHLTREISVVTSFSSDEDMKEVLRFVHTKFPNDKIEINEDDGNSFPKN